MPGKLMMHSKTLFVVGLAVLLLAIGGVMVWQRYVGPRVNLDGFGEAVTSNDIAKADEYLDRYPKLLDMWYGNLAPALHWAAKYGKVEMVGVLLKRGAAVDARDRHGGTALHWGCRQGDPEVVKMLILHGADLDARDRAGLAPLHCAVLEEYTMVAEVLLEGGAGTEFKEYNYGMTPLHLAARNQDVSTIRLLKQHGASLTAEDKSGRSARGWALADELQLHFYWIRPTKGLHGAGITIDTPHHQEPSKVVLRLLSG